MVGVRELKAVDQATLQAIVADRSPGAIAWLRAAAKQGVPRAQAILAQRLLGGEGVAADAGEAVHWFRLAAQADDLDAINMMGRCHENGWGTQQDLRMAAYWYRLAAERGLDWGMYNYANQLMNGSAANGLAADRLSALVWYQRAALLNHAKSINVVGRFHEEGWEVPVDVDTAFALYRRAADGGDFRGQFNYARLLLARGLLLQSLAYLRQIPSTATPAFMHNLRGWLAASASPAVRALIDEPRFHPETVSP